MVSLGGRARERASRTALFTAGKITSLVAMLSHAIVEGLAFAISPRGAAIIVGTELAVLAYSVGPRKPLGVAWTTMVLCTLGRAVYVLINTARRQGLKEQTSVWDWSPEGDGMDSGAWSVLRQLAISFGKMRDDNPDIAELLSDERLQPQELAARMYYMYCEHCHEPLPEQVEQGEPVPEEALEKLRQYRKFAILVYDAVTDSSLSSQLADLGYTLLFASFLPDMDSGCPAFFCALSEERREVMLAIRGTASPEDVFMDVLATGESFDDEDILCHSGMCKAVRHLSVRFRSLLLPLHQAGYQVTILGHSLGAGVAALLTAYFKRKGMSSDRLQCLAYETPPCMDLSLARDCKDVVLSLVHGDDIVPRMCAESLASFLEELVEFDWKPVAEREGVPRGLELLRHLGSVLPWRTSTEAAGDEGAKKEATSALSQAAQDVRGVSESMGHSRHPDGVTEVAGDRECSSTGVYKPFVPGRVVLVARDGHGTPRRTLLPDPSAPVLRTFRLTACCITDHFIDSAELGEVLGDDQGTNGEAQPAAAEEEGSGDAVPGTEREAPAPEQDSTSAEKAKEGKGQ